MATPTFALDDVLVDERHACDELRRQIARLERRGTPSGLWPGGPAYTGHVAGSGTPEHATGGRGPRLLGLGELEALRDDMLHGPATHTGSAETSAHARLEAMLADPAAHRRERIALRELGRPGCGAYSVRPRLGLLGMLAGWWEVKLSSGCP